MENPLFFPDSGKNITFKPIKNDKTYIFSLIKGKREILFLTLAGEES
jgi:hypothetical protein